ncbi:hypothetical protein KUTeg_008856 [Tegillarca granosa]|uniref:RING-type E3 ubiquitin transferase n=1 Tax=Tegillarca granosa TaxID=220873 RepID=A0ABQ9FF54_TEGGR|nr:hypothetical protein KUTeg_008856 [Tegillarca granosa]
MNYIFSLFQRRICMILFYTCTPYCLQKLLDWLERKLKSPYLTSLPVETKEFLLKCIPVLRQSVTFLYRCHLAIFYLKGIFYHIAKRVTGVQYPECPLCREKLLPQGLIHLQNYDPT